MVQQSGIQEQVVVVVVVEGVQLSTLVEPVIYLG